MMRRKVYILLIIASIMLACAGEKRGRSLAPYFSLKDISGQTVTLDSYKGSPLVLVFWAIRCPTCRKEIPRLNALAQEGYSVVGIALDSGREKVADFIRAHHVSYKVLLANHQVLIDYGNIRFLPTIFLIDARGYMVEKMVGGIDEDKLDKFLKGFSS
jgi:peroxiredoxin